MESYRRSSNETADSCRTGWPSIHVGWSVVLLLLLPLVSQAGDTLRVAVISDLNGAYGSTDYQPTVDAAVQRIIALHPDLVISTGDMVAGQRRPHLTRGEVEGMWAAFHRHVSDPLQAAHIPLAVSPGNHDGSAYTGFSLERQIFDEQWGPRRPNLHFVDDAGYPFYYAFELGSTLFVSLDATVVGHLPEQQMRWLQTLLSAHGPQFDRRVIFSHMPLWPLARGREREYIGDPALQTLLADARVELYLSGHHHAFYPGFHHGITYVGQACLGAGPRALIGSRRRSAKAFTMLEFQNDRIDVAAFRGPEFVEVIDWTSLPERVHSPAAELLRADLADASAVAPARAVQ